uniref:TRPM-like domain-containing protein n=1 Tax=Romanomermis culicivorax TaxID=13658 RepID=A0A915KN76_ROMCU
MSKESFLDYFSTLCSKFEEKAVNLIDIGFTVNKEKAMKLACTASAIWGDSHSMDLAAAANDNEFLASQCCQTNIFAWWKAGFDAAGYLIVFATFTLLPVLFFVDFDDETIAARDEAFAVIDADKRRKTGALRNKRQPTSHLVLSARTSGDYPLTVPFIWMAAVVPKKRVSWSKKLFTFYTSPVVKFTNHLFWYALFLLLHAYVLLFSFRYVFTWPEILLHAWFSTFLFELGRTTFLCGSQSMIDKFLDYLDYSSFAMWNRIELYSAFLQIVTRDLFMFLMLLIIMMIAYSVTSQALLYPHRNYYTGIFYDILNHGIWEIFGDLDSVITDPNLPKCGNETFEGNISALMSLTSTTKDCNIRN